MLRFVMGWHGGIVRPTVPVPTHYITKAASRAYVSYNFADYIGVVIPGLVFVVRFLARTRIRLVGRVTVVTKFSGDASSD